MTTQPDELDKLLNDLVDKTFGLHSLQEKHVAQAHQAITTMILKAVIAENDYHWHRQKAIEKEANAGKISGYFLNRIAALSKPIDGGMK